MALLCLLLIMLGSTANAFVLPSLGNTGHHQATTTTTTTSTTLAGFLDRTDMPYGEESRKFRRTVYTHDDWVKHRSPDRFFTNLLTTTTSGIYKVRCIGHHVTTTWRRRTLQRWGFRAMVSTCMQFCWFQFSLIFAYLYNIWCVCFWNVVYFFIYFGYNSLTLFLIGFVFSSSLLS